MKMPVKLILKEVIMMKGASPVYIIQHFVSFGKQIDRGFGKFSLINETSNYIMKIYKIYNHRWEKDQ